MPFNSPAAGVIVEIFVEDGGSVEKGGKLFKLKLGAVEGGSEPLETKKTEEISSPPPPPPSPSLPPPPTKEAPPSPPLPSAAAGPAPQQQPPG